MRGSISQILRKQQCGFIRSQDGDEFYFKSEDFEHGEVKRLHIGQTVEFEVQYGFERPHAVNIHEIHVKERAGVGSSAASVGRHRR